MPTPEQLLSRNLRPKWPRHWYGLAIVTVLTGSISVVPLAFAALHRPPSDASLRRSLLVAAHPQVTALRKKLAGRVAVGEARGLFFRAPECVVKDIVATKILRFGRSITGVVRVACVWKNPDQRTFRSRQEAEDAELSQQEPGTLRLTFVYEAGSWTYRKMNKD